MRILFFGDYSNLHACIAAELKRRGHEVTVISDGGKYMDTGRDILLDRAPGPWGTVKYLYRIFSLLPTLSGYDVVQLINPHFLNLKPGKIKYVFDILKRQNRSIFLTLAGDDANFANACLNTDLFRFSEFKVGDTQTPFERRTHRAAQWSSPMVKEFGDYVYANIDGAMSVLPEYDMAARPLLGERLAFTNIPVEISNLDWHEPDTSGPITIFIGMRGGMEVQKGTQLLYEMAQRIAGRHPGKIVVKKVTNLPLTQYLKEMSRAHIVLDQLYSYSPGTNGFQAMALGPVAATGAQPEFYEYIGQDKDDQPIFCLDPTDTRLEEKLEALACDPGRIKEMSRSARRLVELNNDVRIVTDRFEQHWNKILSQKS